MTPKLLLALILPIAFSACEIESDLILPESQSVTSMNTGLKLDLAASTALFVRMDSCVDLSTTHWLSGVGIEQPIPEMNSEEAYKGSAPPKRFVIKASGDAMSETLTRGLSTLELVYHTGTRKLTGELITQFHFGEVLELTFDDDARVKYDGKVMNLQADVLTAILRTSTQSFILSSGEITLTIPIQPGGELKAEINSGAILCIE